MRRALTRLSIGLSFLVAVSGCDSNRMATSPGVPVLPVLVPDATALTNLSAVLQLEQATGRKTRLIAVSGLVNRQGRLAGSDPWFYTFQEANDIPGALHQWRVDASGQVTYEHLGMCGLHGFSQSLTGDLGLDSDRVVALALQGGGETFLQQHHGLDQFGVIYGDGQAQVTLATPDCYRPWVLIDRRTGVVMSTNLICTLPTGRPCGGPGAY